MALASRHLEAWSLLLQPTQEVGRLTLSTFSGFVCGGGGILAVEYVVKDEGVVQRPASAFWSRTRNVDVS